MALRFFVIFACFISGIPAYALPPGRGTPVMLIHKYEHEGQKLSIVTIIMREHDADLVPTYPNLSHHTKYAQGVLEYLKNWVPEAYIRIGLIKRGDPIHQSLLHEESLLDDRSAIVFVAEENNLYNIHSFIRIARRGYLATNEQHALELRSPGVRLPAAPAHEARLGSAAVIAGESAELKNCIHDPNIKENYLGLMLWRAEHAGIFDYTFRRDLHNGTLRLAVPSYVAGETHGGTIKYFQNEWGFQLMPEISNPSEAFKFYIKIDLPTLYNVNDKLQQPREGKRLPVKVNPNGFHLVLWSPVALKDNATPCFGLLGEKLPFYKEIDHD